jgi:geranylgeranyl transferase type-2 subunit beta
MWLDAAPATWEPLDVAQDPASSTSLKTPGPNESETGRQNILAWRQHIEYIATLGARTQSFEYHVTEHLRMSGIYWGLGALSILDATRVMDRDGIIAFVRRCQCPDTGGFAGNLGHDPHILHTLSALQILAILGDGAIDAIDASAAARYVLDLQMEDGSFAGDEWGEVDTRFAYCALCALAILARVGDADLPKVIDWILSCQNFDGGFGCVPGAESHAGQIWTCVAALSIAGADPGLEGSDSGGHALWRRLRGGIDRLGWWLCERQCDSGGLNGRPEKQADVCYSWWVLSSLAIIGRQHWIDGDALVAFILDCQDPEDGGISDRPDDMADVYHTFFGLCGLSHLGWLGRCVDCTRGMTVRPIDPTYALPRDTVVELGMRSLEQR